MDPTSSNLAGAVGQPSKVSQPGLTNPFSQMIRQRKDLKPPEVLPGAKTLVPFTQSNPTVKEFEGKIRAITSATSLEEIQAMHGALVVAFQADSINLQQFKLLLAGLSSRIAITPAPLRDPKGAGGLAATLRIIVAKEKEKPSQPVKLKEQVKGLISKQGAVKEYITHLQQQSSIDARTKLAVQSFVKTLNQVIDALGKEVQSAQQDPKALKKIREALPKEGIAELCDIFDDLKTLESEFVDEQTLKNFVNFLKLLTDLDI